MKFSLHHKLFILALSTLYISVFAMTPASAKLKFWEKDDEPEIEVFQPPPVDTLERECGAIKLEIQTIYRKNFLMRHLLIPRREYLLAKHEQCKKNFADQEFKYLKHIEIANPKLPELEENASDETNTEP